MLLAINTASSNTAIALIDEPKNTIISEMSWISANNEAEKIMPAIDNLLQSQKLDYDSLKQIIAVRGPGSFTGLRVGITVANTLRYLLQAELYQIDSFQLHWQAHSTLHANSPKNNSQNSALLIFAGKGGVYVSLKPHEIGTLVNMPELPKYLAQNEIQNIFGDVSAEQKNTLSNFKWLENTQTFAQTIVNLDFSRLKKVDLIEPLYIKDPGITRGRNKLTS